MYIWRLVLLEGGPTLTELETTWNMDDVERAIAVLDMRSEYEKKTAPKSGNK